MKTFLIVIVIGGAAYWAWQNNNHETEAGSVIDPVYTEFRVEYTNGIELVGIGKMDSQSDCERRSERFWSSVLATDADAKISGFDCKGDIPARFETLFHNQQGFATYIAMDRGNAGERDGRFIIYGAPSSEVMKVCPVLINRIKQKYRGKVECIQGSVG